MAQNYIQPGDTITYIVPAGGVTSGDLLIQGVLAGVALGTGVEDAEVELGIDGVYSLAKVTGAITQGQVVYFDTDEEKVTTAAEGGSPWGDFVRVGVATSAAGSSDATVEVKLNK